MLSLRSTGLPKATCAPRRSAASRRAVVNVRAGMLDDIGAGFMKIFSPPKDDAPNGNWQGTTNSFGGRIDHHGKGRPFKDGFTGAKAAAEEGAAAAAEAAEAAGNEAMGYVEGAVKGVMGKNFPGKEDEDKPSTGSAGWQGDIHGRKKDGFHAPRS